MSLTDEMEFVETSYNVYDADEHFTENYPTEAQARRNCPPGGRVAERDRYEYYEDGKTVYTRPQGEERPTTS